MTTKGDRLRRIEAEKQRSDRLIGVANDKLAELEKDLESILPGVVVTIRLGGSELSYRKNGGRWGLFWNGSGHYPWERITKAPAAVQVDAAMEIENFLAEIERVMVARNEHFKRVLDDEPHISESAAENLA